MKTPIKPLLQRVLSLILSLVLLVTMGAVALPVAAHTAENSAKSTESGQKVEVAIKGKCDYEAAYEILDLVNAERKKVGKKALVADRALMGYAMQRAAECSVYYSHTRPNGDVCFSVFDDQYMCFSAGENIAAGYTDADTVMDAWMNSPSHRVNVLDEMDFGFQTMGIGVFQVDGTYYWCQLFSAIEKQQDPLWKTATTKIFSIEAESNLLQISGEETELYLNDDDTATIKVKNSNLGFYNRTHTLDKSQLIFSSSDPSVVKVTQTGMVIAISNGSATITVKSRNGVKLLTVSVTAHLNSPHTIHIYAPATCTKPRTCTLCGGTTGKALGHSYDAPWDDCCSTCGATRIIVHDYMDATCTTAQTCKICGTTCGSALGHTYENAWDKVCSSCGATRIVNHEYKAATCTKAKTCKICGTTSGKPLGHTYSNACDKTCNTCGATRTVTHSYKTVTKKATATANGYTVKRCSVCAKETGKTTIYKASTIKLSTTSYTYNGSAKKPSVVIKDSKGKTIAASNYTVTYASGRKNVGTYKVTVKFQGKYTGTKTLTFKINPVKTSISKLTAGSKKLTVKWAKKTTQVTGYEIQYSTSKTFKSYKTKTITKNSTTSATLTGLTAKKTYYVRVRTYKTVNGKKVYSGWSTIVSKKTT